MSQKMRDNLHEALILCKQWLAEHEAGRLVESAPEENQPETFAGDLESSRKRFRMVADLMLKNGTASMLNHASYGLAVSLKVYCDLDIEERITKELKEEREVQRARRGLRLLKSGISSDKSQVGI